MPIPNTPVPAFPSVPQASGVPALLRQVGSVQNTVVTVVADAQLILRLFQPPQWGLFFNGFPVVLADSVISMGYKADSHISTAPQEEGGWAAYNKVQVPADTRMVFAKGGLPSDKTVFLQALTFAQESLDLYTVVMPEGVIINMNVVRFDYDRSQRKGAGLLQVDVWLEEVRVVGAPQFTNTQAASGQDPSNNGTVQPGTPSASQIPPAGGLT